MQIISNQTHIKYFKMINKNTINIKMLFNLRYRHFLKIKELLFIISELVKVDYCLIYFKLHGKHKEKHLYMQYKKIYIQSKC
jgi:hypothetical protein